MQKHFKLWEQVIDACKGLTRMLDIGANLMNIIKTKCTCNISFAIMVNGDLSFIIGSNFSHNVDYN
jgi:hypothetical protein